MKKVILDNELYHVPNGLYDDLDRALVKCYGICNEHTLRELKEACEKIRQHGKKQHIDLVATTPVLEGELPF